jgi:hypothetical protein
MNRARAAALPSTALFVGLPWAAACAQEPPAAPAPPSEAAPVSAAAPAPVSAPAPDAEAQRDAAAWRGALLAARDKLLDGEFQAAATALQSLMKAAPTPQDHAVAQALEQLAARWQQRGLMLVRRTDVGESDYKAKATDRRSTGELAALYLGAVGYGLGTGAYVAIQAEPESISGVTVPMLVFAAAVPVGVFLLDDNTRVRYGTPSAITNGLTLGLLEGALWTGWYQAQARRNDEVSGKTAATLVWLPTTIGGVAGGLLGEKQGTTPGRAEMIGAGGTFGAALTALFLSSALDAGQEQDDAVLLGSAIMANVGAVAGYIGGRAWSPGVARVRYIQLGGLSGALLTSLLYLSVADENSEADSVGAITAVGMAAGLGVSTWLTNDMDPDLRREQSQTSAQLLLTPTPGGGLSLGAVGQF